MSASKCEQKLTDGHLNKTNYETKKLRIYVQGDSKNGPKWSQSAPNIVPEVISVCGMLSHTLPFWNVRNTLMYKTRCITRPGKNGLLPVGRSGIGCTKGASTRRSKAAQATCVSAQHVKSYAKRRL